MQHNQGFVKTVRTRESFRSDSEQKRSQNRKKDAKPWHRVDKRQQYA